MADNLRKYYATETQSHRVLFIKFLFHQLLSTVNYQIFVTIQVSQQEWAKRLWATCPPSFWRKLFKKLS